MVRTLFGANMRRNPYTAKRNRVFASCTAAVVSSASTPLTIVINGIAASRGTRNPRERMFKREMLLMSRERDILPMVRMLFIRFPAQDGSRIPPLMI